MATQRRQGGIMKGVTQGFDANVAQHVKKDKHSIQNPWFRPMIFERDAAYTQNRWTRDAQAQRGELTMPCEIVFSNWPPRQPETTPNT
jgi:hypothetical protein